MSKLNWVVACAICTLSIPVIAATYDGSKIMICAPVETVTCSLNSGCYLGEAEDVNLDRFLEIDVTNKTVTGVDTQRTTPIQNVKTDGDQLVLQGAQNGRAWSATISQKTGELTVGVAGHNQAFTVFGACMVK